MRRLKILGGWIALATGLLLTATPAHAQRPDFQATINSCLAVAGGVPATNDKTVGDAIEVVEGLVGAACTWQKPADKAAAVEQLKWALEAVRAEAATHCGRSQASNTCVVLRAVEERAAALSSQAAIGRGAGYFQLNGSVHPGYTGDRAINFAARLSEQASPPQDDTTTCRKCYEAALELAPAVVYAKVVEVLYLFGPNSDGLALVSKDLAAREQRWDAYHFGGGDKRVQLPWELALNGVIYANDSKQATNTPPDGAFILLHPSVGLTLKDKEGVDSNLVGVVELFGYSTWGYDDKTNQRGSEWGGSLIAAYQPSDVGDDWGYGVLVRTPWSNINVAWVRTELDAGGSDESFLISVDLTSLLPKGLSDVLGFKRMSGE